MNARWHKAFPLLSIASRYNREFFVKDVIAALTVTVLLIPQSLAYALIAGVPVEIGLYASILPLIVYAIFGSSHSLSVGPVAVISLMTASALGKVAQQHSVDYIQAAIALSFLSGAMSVVMGYLRFGFIVNFISHSVVSGFITASSIIIALGQFANILGVSVHGDTVIALMSGLITNLDEMMASSVLIGVAAVIFLLLARRYAVKLLTSLGLNASLAAMLSKTAPILAVVLTTGLAYSLALRGVDLQLVGLVPSGLPEISLSLPSIYLLQDLLLPAFLITLIGYVESISVGKTLAANKNQKINPNQELKALGFANIASGVSGAFPVTGGFSRSVVNHDAGAVTQVASIFAAMGIALAALFLTPVLSYLPKATLAATIIVAVLSLVDIKVFGKTWRFDKSDFTAVSSTILVTLLLGVEIGVACGIAASILLYLYRTSHPHIAEVGLVKDTQHFRNVLRFETETNTAIVSLRPDGSLFFANIDVLEDRIMTTLESRGNIKHVVLLCSAINDIDFSALEVLEKLNRQLQQRGIGLHLSEVKGPVMDKIKATPLIQDLNGRIFLTQFEAYTVLCREQAEPPKQKDQI